MGHWWVIFVILNYFLKENDWKSTSSTLAQAWFLTMFLLKCIELDSPLELFQPYAVVWRVLDYFGPIMVLQLLIDLTKFLHHRVVNHTIFSRALLNLVDCCCSMFSTSSVTAVRRKHFTNFGQLFIIKKVQIFKDNNLRIAVVPNIIFYSNLPF